MPTTIIDDLTDEFQATKKFTAAADTDCRLTNPSGEFLFFEIRPDATVPSGSARRYQILGPKQFDKFRILSGETILFGGRGAIASLLAV